MYEQDIYKFYLKNPSCYGDGDFLMIKEAKEHTGHLTTSSAIEVNKQT